MAGEKNDSYLGGPGSALPESELHPPPAKLPYLVPKANVSRESLQSLSDPRDNPYTAIYSAPPSPVGGYSPFSDQMSISGRSGRNLLTPTFAEDPNSSFKQPPRVPSPLAFASEMSPQSNDQPSKALAPPEQISRAASPSRSIVRSPLRERFDQEENTLTDPFTPPVSKPESPVKEVKEGPPAIAQQEYSAVYELKVPDAAMPRETPPATGVQFEEKHMSITRRRSQTVPSILHSTEDVRHSTGYVNSVDHYDHQSAELDRVHSNTEDVEADEDRAKRIQSVYQEYWNDAHYLDGSEEWEATQHAHHQVQHQTRPPVASSIYDQRQTWRDSAQDYYETQNWQQEHHREASYDHRYQPHEYQSHERYHSQERYQHPRSGQHPIGLGIDSNWESPPPRPSFHSRPSTSYSTSSLPSQSRTPSKPLEPLNDLPTRYKLDELASPISFSKPKRFAGPAGRDQSLPRSQSPVQVLSSSWSNLQDLPTPHRLRRSGSFSSIEFAPVRKFAPSEVDAGDTGSIRSIARTEASLMAVSAGAGRVNRLPQDIVPLGKAGMMAQLRPQNYGDVRYV
jgi:hypothetical protein